MPAIAAILQDFYPPQVQVAVTALSLGMSVETYRVVGGVRTPVRGGFAASADRGAYFPIDAELPFGVPVSYVAVVNGTEYTTPPVTYNLDNELPVFTDAITRGAAESIINAWDQRTFDRDVAVFRVGSRNVVVAGPIGQYESQIELLVMSATSAANLRAMFSNATQGIVLLRNAIGTINDYLAITRITERRFSQDRTDERRYFVLEVVEVDPWASSLEALGYTYQDVADHYSTGTYADAMADYSTYLAASLGDYS